MLATLLAWASGLRLYFVVFSIGMAGYFGYLELPPGLAVLRHSWVIGAAGFLLVMEFLVDKVQEVASMAYQFDSGRSTWQKSDPLSQCVHRVFPIP